MRRPRTQKRHRLYRHEHTSRFKKKEEKPAPRLLPLWARVGKGELFGRLDPLPFQELLADPGGHDLLEVRDRLRLEPGREKLSDAAGAAAWMEGWAMPVEAAIRDAVGS